jgi:hypothetical protein
MDLHIFKYSMDPDNQNDLSNYRKSNINWEIYGENFESLVSDGSSILEFFTLDEEYGNPICFINNRKITHDIILFITNLVGNPSDKTWYVLEQIVDNGFKSKLFLIHIQTKEILTIVMLALKNKQVGRANGEFEIYF